MCSDREKLIVIGAGGHARSVIDIILQNGNYDIVGCVDSVYPDVVELPGMKEIPIIGNDDNLEELYSSGIKNIFIAIGNNSLRAKLYKKSINIGFNSVTIISKNAVVSPKAVIGKGTCVMPGAVINVNCCIGDNCIVNTNCSLDHDCLVRNHCHIAPGAAISGTVVLGEFVQIGTGASVIDAMTIGSGSFVGAGSVVVKNIPERVLVYGVPAKIIRKYE